VQSNAVTVLEGRVQEPSTGGQPQRVVGDRDQAFWHWLDYEICVRVTPCRILNRGEFLLHQAGRFCRYDDRR